MGIASCESKTVDKHISKTASGGGLLYKDDEEIEVIEVIMASDNFLLGKCSCVLWFLFFRIDSNNSFSPFLQECAIKSADYKIVLFKQIVMLVKLQLKFKNLS